MPDDVSIALQLVLLIAQLKRPGMMNEIRNAALIAMVGDNPDVPSYSTMSPPRHSEMLRASDVRRCA